MNETVRISAIVFVAVASGILLIAVAATLAIAAGAPEGIRLPFLLICHGIESRSPFIAGEAMPICFRCTGIYVGMLLGIGMGVPAVRWGRAPFPGWGVWVLAAPLIIDGVTQVAGLRESTNDLRVVTGLVAGAGFLLWAITNVGVVASRSGDLPARDLGRKSQAKD